MNVRAAEKRDIDTWAAMRHALWPDATRQDPRNDLTAFFEDKSLYITAAFIAEREDGSPLGFIELNLRPYAEGCESSPVPHIEGWYVIPTARQSGVGTALMHAAETWALAHNFHEITSDTTDRYPLSVRAHTANGFKEVERLIAFRKKLR
jgi:aminoglycoside 6'-N-acetyltransferase I